LNAPRNGGNPLPQWAGRAQSLWQIATGRKGWRLNPGAGKNFHTYPDQPWGPPSLLYNGYPVSFPQ